MSIGNEEAHAQSMLIYGFFISPTETSKQMKTRTDFSPIVFLGKKMQRSTTTLGKTRQNVQNALYASNTVFIFFPPKNP